MFNAFKITGALRHSKIWNNMTVGRRASGIGHRESGIGNHLSLITYHLSLTMSDLISLLKPFGQEHLLRFWDSLNEQEQSCLSAQIRNIDFRLIAELYQNRDHTIDLAPFEQRAKDPPAYKFGELSEGNPDYSAPKKIGKADAIQLGQEALAKGTYAVMIVAGGQGTRLGFPHPKGMYPIGLNGETLFQIHFEKVVALTKKYGVVVPLCIMTSPATHDETVEYLGQNDWFGITPENRFLFCQGTMPAVSMLNGKVLLADKGTLALSPDGHGGMLAAINKQSILDQLQERGIKHLFYFQVDNPFVDICSPEFLGYHLASGSEMTSQAIRKREPSDRVGNVVELDGKLHVIEYSDIPESLANRRFPDGSLQIWAGSIAVHQFDLGFLRRVSPIASALPFHIAKKKVSYVDEHGQMVVPQEPNAIKFERFIFDLMPSANNAVVVEVDIPNNYGPLKNAPGSATDSPETVKAQLLEMDRRRSS
ncbi:MAG: UDPGP type 1 family protein [Planctomycetaceae bacterium]|nr:UDPGP type 1 family protein [Planctomycetaceae bacterium]